MLHTLERLTRLSTVFYSYTVRMVSDCVLFKSHVNASISTAAEVEIITRGLGSVAGAISSLICSVYSGRVNDSYGEKALPFLVLTFRMCSVVHFNLLKHISFWQVLLKILHHGCLLQFQFCFRWKKWLIASHVMFVERFGVVIES